MTGLSLLGLAEVAQLLGVNKRTVTRYAAQPDFPTPLARLAAGPVWEQRAIEEWAAAHGPFRRGRPPRRARDSDGGDGAAR